MAKKKEEKTNVMRILDQKKIPYTARFYDDSEGPEGTREYGVHVAAALGQELSFPFQNGFGRDFSSMQPGPELSHIPQIFFYRSGPTFLPQQFLPESR